jgi:phosphonate transport system permease protein
MARLTTISTPLTAMPPRPAPRGRWILAAIAVLIIASFASLKGEWRGLFSLESLSNIGNLFGRFLPLETSPDFLRKVGVGFVETLAISFLGTLLALIAAIVLAIPASGFVGAASRAVTRGVLNVLRAVPELVWASLLVIAAGLGPFPGTLALALHTAGVLGRLLADAMENAPPEPYFALRRNGATAIHAFCYATLPVVLPQLASYTLYRWENNIRAAAVLGVVGAGGLGQLLYYHMGLLQFRDAGTVLVAMIVLVAIVDTISARLNARLAR